MTGERKRADRPPAVLEGRRLAGSSSTARPGECTYTVAEPTMTEPSRPVSSGDKRNRPRQRTRLRTGKILDARGQFQTECLIYDRSDTGGRLRLPADIALAASIQLYEDQSAALLQADIVWREKRNIGIRFRAFVATPRTRALEAEMQRRFYAVKG